MSEVSCLPILFKILWKEELIKFESLQCTFMLCSQIQAAVTVSVRHPPRDVLMPMNHVWFPGICEFREDQFEGNMSAMWNVPLTYNCHRSAICGLSGKIYHLHATYMWKYGVDVLFSNFPPWLTKQTDLKVWRSTLSSKATSQTKLWLVMHKGVLL